MQKHEEKIEFFYLFIFLSVTPWLFSATTSYPINPYVDPVVWEKVSPHFVPYDNPLRRDLDKIFSKKRVIANIQSLEEAGFNKIGQRKSSGITIAAHPKIKGVLFKLFTDDVDKVDWLAWITRIEGAAAVTRAIKELHYEEHFKVPQKWIYPLPISQTPIPNGLPRKNFILVVEDMRVLKSKANRKQWKGPFMNKKRMKAIFTIIEREGLVDSVIVSNLPFNAHGKQCFIDTEYYHAWPVSYEKLLPCFAKEKQGYWLELTQNKRNF